MSTTEPIAASVAAMKMELCHELKLPTAVLGLDVAGDGTRLYAACLDGGVYTLDAESGSIEQLSKHDSYASGVALLPQSGLLISAGYDGALLWYDLASRQVIR